MDFINLVGSLDFMDFVDYTDWFDFTDLVDAIGVRDFMDSVDPMDFIDFMDSIHTHTGFSLLHMMCVLFLFRDICVYIVCVYFLNGEWCMPPPQTKVAWEAKWQCVT